MQENFMRAYKGALLFLLIAASLSAHADELELHITSYHQAQGAGLNETNLGLGYNYDWKPELQLIGGGFTNSYDDLSLYLGAKWLPLEISAFKAGLVLGVVTGYDDHIAAASPIQPIVLPELQLSIAQFALITRLIPSLGGDTGTVLTFSLGYSF